MVTTSMTSPEPRSTVQRGVAVTPAALNVKQVAALLGVSARHIYRMADGGLMPRPFKLGGLNRWHRPAIEAWLADGAKPVRK